jgi:hypothetical protein
MPAGAAWSGHRVNDRSVEVAQKVSGKVLYTQQIDVSSDGKTLTMTVHVPGRSKPDIQLFYRE